MIKGRIKNWKEGIGLAGVCCLSLCFLGFPILMALTPTSWMGATIFEWMLRGMFFVFCYLSARTGYEAFKRHHKFSPLLLLLISGIALVLRSFYIIPRWAGYLALSLFILAWVWNRLHLHKTDQATCHN